MMRRKLRYTWPTHEDDFTQQGERVKNLRRDIRNREFRYVLRSLDHYEPTLIDQIFDMLNPADMSAAEMLMFLSATLKRANVLERRTAYYERVREELMRQGRIDTDCILRRLR